MSYYNLRFCYFFVPCQIPDVWSNRAHGKEMKETWEAGSHFESIYKYYDL